MEEHLIEIICYAICVLCLVGAIAVMVKAEDNDLLRRITPVVAAIPIYFNYHIGNAIYLLIGATLETLLAAMGVGFVLIFGLVIMLLPILLIIRWAIH